MRHATDGALVRWMDRECEAPERETLGQHLAGCQACAARLAGFERKTRRIHAALARSDTRSIRRAAIARRWRVPVALAAAVLLAVVGSVAPLRAWVVDHVATIWAAVGGDAPHAAPAEVPDQASSGGGVSFVPAGERFTLEIVARQAAGSLTIETTGEDVASAEIMGGSGDESLVVLPTGLRIETLATARASYTVRLPMTLQEITVTLGDRAVQRVHPTRSGERWTLPLAAPR